MPGFNVSGIGEAKGNTNVKPYYQHTWKIDHIFGDQSTNPPLIYLKQATFPAITFRTEQVSGTALIYKFASEVFWENVRVTWYDTYGLLTFIKKWRLSVWEPEKGLKAANDYKQRSVLTKMTSDETSNVQWTLFNSWPESIREGDLSYINSEIKVVEVSISYDWAIDVET